VDRFHPLRVAGIDRLTADAVTITLDVPQDLREEFRYRAGQHLSVRSPVLGDGVRRNYSLCAPATSGRVQIGVKRIPGGTFSEYATERLRPGDVLEAMTPTGSFGPVLRPGRARRYAAIAAGSGITPVLSILATALEVEADSTASLVYVNRSTADVMFLEELADLKDRHTGRFQLVHVLDGEPRDVGLLSGRLDAERLGRLLDGLVGVPGVDEWYLCGPLPLTDTARAVLLARGADPEHVHRELFHVGPPSPRPPVPADEGTGASVTAVLDGRSCTFRLPCDGAPILDAVLRVRPEAPYACKNAVCGTCRALVLEGEVEMDASYALEPDERRAGYVLTCQAHPVGERVTVDYDR
jgi:ring-1,2-phenylacetyl-CoA epoxidase subunit PaaE